MKSLEKWIKKQGFDYKPFGDLTPEGFKQKGFVIMTDYEGAYPSKEVYQIHDKIFAYARKTGRECWQHIMGVCVYIYA